MAAQEGGIAGRLSYRVVFVGWCSALAEPNSAPPSLAAAAAAAGEIRLLGPVPSAPCSSNMNMCTMLLSKANCFLGGGNRFSETHSYTFLDVGWSVV